MIKTVPLRCRMYHKNKLTTVIKKHVLNKLYHILGCGFNTSNRSCFFTKNGKYIGLAFKDMRKDLAFFPTIGMNSIGEKVEVNFGQKPFLYNIELEKILQEANEKDLNSKENTKKGRKRVSEEEIDKIVII